MLQVARHLTFLLFLGPVLAGLVGTTLPAFGYLPGAGRAAFTLDPWRGLLAMPGLGTALATGLFAGLVGTALALLAAASSLAALFGTPWLRRALVLLPALLAVPHLASAVGLGLLAGPSGWLPRLLSPWLTGWERPPDASFPMDPYGLALALGLALREAPFLLLAMIAALDPAAAARSLDVGRSLGHGRTEAFVKLVLPTLYRHIRLPLLAVMAFALSVVDMAIVLGPSAPPVLAVQVTRWLGDPDTALRLTGAAGALLQLALVLATVAAWCGLESLAARLSRAWLQSAPRRWLDRAARGLGQVMALAVLGAGAAGLLILGLWSVAGRWRFPASWPGSLSLASWQAAADSLATPLLNTVLVAALSTAIAVVLALACLESEARAGGRSGRLLWLLWLPLLIPQIAFLFGLQVAAIEVGLDGSLVGLVLVHLVFVLPYVMLMLREPYLALDPQLPAAARLLGRRQAAAFWRVKLPLVMRPLAVAAAIGATVSIALYLPTLFVGAGRYPTLTTETLALAVGGDRRLAAVAALLLAALPLVAVAGALTVGGAAPLTRGGAGTSRPAGATRRRLRPRPRRRA